MSERVVVCESDPEVAVIVTVEAPAGAGVGFGLVGPLLDPPHPVREDATSKRRMDPQPTTMDLRNFFRFRITGKSAARPMGRMIPAARGPVHGLRLRRDVEYGLGGGAVYEPAVMVRVVLALAPAAGVTELGEN